VCANRRNLDAFFWHGPGPAALGEIRPLRFVESTEAVDQATDGYLSSDKVPEWHDVGLAEIATCRRSCTVSNDQSIQTRRVLSRSEWTLLSNHGHVLICIADDPDARLRDVADRVGVTERSAFALVNDLVNAGVIERSRIGRRNSYVVNRNASLGRLLQDSASVGRLLASIGIGARSA
jgi:hypothetical protein